MRAKNKAGCEVHVFAFVQVSVQSDTLGAVLVKIWRSVAAVTVEDKEIIGSARSTRCTAE